MASATVRISILGKLQKNYPKYFIWTILAVSLLILYRIDTHYGAFITNDWLINYEGGFVRRGLIGQIILYATRITAVPPWVFVYVLQSTAYILIALFAIKKLEHGVNAIGLAFLFSPVVFLFEVYEFGGLGRKELIFISVLAINGYFLERLQHQHRVLEKKYYISISAFMALGILAHESFIFYFPLLLLQLACYQQLSSTRTLIIPIAASLLAFGLTVAYRGNDEVVHAILNSLAPYVSGINCDGDGAICSLRVTADAALMHTIGPGKRHLVLLPVLVMLAYSIVFLLAFARNNCESPGYYKKITIALVLAELSMAPLFVIAIDYGRWVHIFVTGLFFAIPNKLLNDRTFLSNTNLSIRRTAIATFLLFTFSWNISCVRSESIGFGIWEFLRGTVPFYLSNAFG